VDILTHLDIRPYPVDFRRVVRAAAQAGIAVEFNNANLMYGKTDPESVRQLADAVLESGCRAVISGDAHTVFEIGEDGSVRDAFARLGVPPIPMINDTVASAEAFIAERRERRRRVTA
jgi:putative hydrolase